MQHVNDAPLTPPLTPQVDKTSHAAFVAACQTGMLQNIKDALKTHPAYINMANGYDNNTFPLHYAVLRKDMLLVRLMLLNGANADVQSSNGSTPLHWASGLGLTDICRELGRVTNLQAPDSTGYLASHMAAQNGHALTLLLLLAMDPGQLNATDSHGRTVLHWASIKNDPEMIVAICAFAAHNDQLSQTVNWPDWEYGMTPLHWTAHLCFTDGCRWLLKYGASPMIKDKKGRLPLDLAIAKNYQKHYELSLLESGMTISQYCKSKLWLRLDPKKASFWVGKVWPHLVLPYLSAVIGYSSILTYPVWILMLLATHFLIAKFVVPTVPLMETAFLRTVHWNWYIVGWGIMLYKTLPGLLSLNNV